VAELVSKCVQVSIGLSKEMDIKTGETDADAIRLSVATISSPIIGEYFASHGKAPTDPEMAKMIGSLKAVLGFADKFAPTDENIGRVAASDVSGVPGIPGDETQMTIQYLQAMVPVVIAVQNFPFGQAEGKLLKEIAEKLSARAQKTTQSLLPQGVDGFLAKQAELRITKMLCEVYASSHRDETIKILGMDQAAREKLTQANNGLFPTDPVWARFEARVKMIEELSLEASGNTPAPAAAAPQQNTAPPQTEQKTQQQAAPETAPQAPPPSQAPETAPQEQAAQETPSAGASPFSGFAKKDNSGGDSAAATPPPAAPPSQTAPPAQTPPANPLEGPPAAPDVPPPAENPAAPQEPPAAPPATPPAEEPPAEGDNPLSMFAGKKKEDGDESKGG